MARFTSSPSETLFLAFFRSYNVFGVVPFAAFVTSSSPMTSWDPLSRACKWCVIIAKEATGKISFTAAPLLSEPPVPLEYAAMLVCLLFYLGQLSSVAPTVVNSRDEAGLTASHRSVFQLPVLRGTSWPEQPAGTPRAGRCCGSGSWGVPTVSCLFPSMGTAWLSAATLFQQHISTWAS